MLRWRLWGAGTGAGPGHLDYPQWIVRRLEGRRPEFIAAPQPGLFSLLTVVQEPKLAWFDELAWSVQAQDFPQFEWVVVDCGAPPAVRTKLKELAKDHRVVLLKAEAPRSYAQGLRLAAEAARQRYLLPVEAEDRLYPDALRIVASFLQQHNYPTLAYSDEDQLLADGTPANPFCKPDWDPLLLFSGPFVTRLAALDRQAALRAGVFSEEAADGCSVWDACCRAVAQGHEPAHLPEILYSRRTPQAALALRTPAKQAKSAFYVLRNHLRRQRLAEKLNLRANPLLGDVGLWRLAWQRTEADEPILCLLAGHTPAELELKLSRLTDDSLVAIHSPGVQLLTDDWADEARTLFAALPDAVVVTGCVLDEDDRVLSAGEFFGLDGLVASPYAGWSCGEARGHGRLLCQQTVSAPSRDFFIAEVGFLKDVLQMQAKEVSLSLLHAWLGAEARAQGFRVVYTPHLLAKLRRGAAEVWPSAEETWRFLKAHWQLLLDDPAWSRFQSLEPAKAFQIATPAERAAVLNRSLCHLAGSLPIEEQLRAAERQYPFRSHRPPERQRRLRAAA